MNRRHWFLLVLLSFSMSMATARPTLGAGADRSLVGYKLTSWTHIGGIPRNDVYAVAQGTDGYLWVGTEAGLSRFDGMRFVAWDAIGAAPLPKGSVRFLCAGHDGSLWVIVRQEDGRSVLAHATPKEVRTYDEHDGLAMGRPTMLMEDLSGALWVGGDGGLFMRVGDKWINKTDSQGPQNALGGSRAATGIIVVASNGIFRQNGDKFQSVAGEGIVSGVGKYDGVSSVAQDTSGTTFISDPLRGFRAVDRRARLADLHDRGRGVQLLFDRAGNLWVGTYGQGVWQMRAGKADAEGAVTKALESNGLPSDVVFALMEDRDGNVWAGTSGGLCRFVRQEIDQVRDLGIVRAVSATPDGDVWVGASVGASDALISFKRGTTEPGPQHISLGSARLMALQADRSGHLWVATDRFLGRTDGLSLHTVPGTQSLRQIAWLAPDSHGGSWIYDLNCGLVHWADAKWSAAELPADVSKARLLTGYVDQGGRLWATLADGRVLTLDASGAKVLGRSAGLTAGIYHAIYEDESGDIWLGATAGLSRVSANRGVTVLTKNSFVGEITAIVEDANGVLWLGTPRGIVRLAINEFEKGVNNPDYSLVHAVYTRDEGLAGHPITVDWGGLRAVRSMDGRLWFVTNSGITAIDSSAVTRSRVTHPVIIEDIIADDTRLSPDQSLVLAPHTSKLAIDYTTLDLTTAFRSQFRYRLNGVDDKWVNAGTRQEAFYTNLRPGRYTFTVMATDDENAWTIPPTAVNFEIPPMFYQTMGFMLLAAAAGVAVIGFFWRLRVNRLRQGFSMVMAERTRMSRDMHDTLLQNLVASTLQCEAVAADPSIGSPQVREQIRGVRERIEESIRDARRAIADLRESTANTQDLVSSLRATVAAATRGTSLTVDFTVQGRLMSCLPEVQRQLIAIAREAVTNVVRHAHASRVCVELCSERVLLALTIADDGTGFDVGATSRKAVAYGLVGMRERAESVGGSVTLVSSPGSGTSLEVRIPLH